MAVRQYIGARYVPKFFEGVGGSPEWVANTQYEALTIVTRNGNSYTSRKNVPSNIGAPETAPEYWVSTGIYNQQIETYRQEVSELSDSFDGLVQEVDDRFVEFESDVIGKNYSFDGSKVVSHAGGGNLQPSNTIQGVNLAIALEADAIEIDCQITSDHVPVCAHDPVVNGITLKNAPYSTVSEIQVASASSHHMGCKIPPLEAVARACKIAQKTLLLEFKWEATGHMEVEDLPYVKALLDKVGIDDVVFISWIPTPLLAYKKLDPSARTIWLLGDPTPTSTENIDQCATYGFWGVGIPVSADGSMIDYAHTKGLRVDSFTLSAWDSNTYKCLQHGSDFITTNDILSCGCFAYPKYDVAFIASAPSVQGVPMINKFSSKVTDPAFPYFMETVTRTNENLTGMSRFSASVSGTRGVSMPLAVKPGDVIKFINNSTYDLSVEVYNTYISTWVANSGWLTGDYTIPANGYQAILNYRRKDNAQLTFWELAGLRSIFGGIVRS